MARHLHLDFSPGVKPVTIDLEASVRPQGGKITELFNELVAHHQRNGLDDTNARDAAFQELEDLYRTGHGHFRDYYVQLKGSKLDVAMLVEHQALRFYDEAMRSPGPVDAAKLRVILERTNSLLDELAIPARKMVDDVEPARATQALRNLEAITPTPLKQTPAQQAPVMMPHEKFDLLPAKGWSVAPDGLTATKVENGVQLVATIDTEHPNSLVTVDITPPGKPSTQIREGSVLRYGDAPSPTGNVIQLHHGVQDALCLELGGPQGMYGDLGYRSNDAPGLWLRDHKGTSPHNKITGLQSGRKPKDFDNFGAIREQGIKDLKAAGRPLSEIQEFTRAWDKYFDEKVWPTIERLYPDPAVQQRIKGVFTEVY
jgi:hypothetical protein